MWEHLPAACREKMAPEAPCFYVKWFIAAKARPGVSDYTLQRMVCIGTARGGSSARAGVRVIGIHGVYRGAVRLSKVVHRTAAVDTTQLWVTSNRCCKLEALESCVRDSEEYHMFL